MPLAATDNKDKPPECRDMNDIFVVSDLHLADGRTGPFEKITHGENFFWDRSFDRFLKKVAMTSNAQACTTQTCFTPRPKESILRP